MKRDYVSVNPTPDARAILTSLPRWIEHYNEHHPHSVAQDAFASDVPTRAGLGGVRVRVWKYGQTSPLLFAPT